MKYIAGFILKSSELVQGTFCRDSENSNIVGSVYHRDIGSGDRPCWRGALGLQAVESHPWGDSMPVKSFFLIFSRVSGGETEPLEVLPYLSGTQGTPEAFISCQN